MKLRTTALLLLLPALSAADQPDWLDSTAKQGKEIMERMEGGRNEVEEAIASLGADNVAPLPENPDESLPEAREGYAVAVADCGLLFDSENSRLTYLGNVRVNEARLNLRCRNRLYIQLPPSQVKKGVNETISPSTPEPGAAHKPAAAPAPEAPQPAPAPKTAQEPLQVRAYDAMVDGVGNHILLRSNGREALPHLIRGNDELVLDAGEGDAYILADALGNIHIQAGKLTLRWADAQGRRGSLVAEQGRMVFNRATHTVYIPGVSHFVAPDGSILDCEESLCVTLMPEGDGKLPENGGFLSQFTSLRYSGVENAVAVGNVRAVRPATETTPVSVVQGEVCTYNGRTGASAITGTPARLTYGTQEMHTLGAGSITLSPDGDILVSGENGCAGAYELPAPKGCTAQRGTYETDGEVIFTAAKGEVHFPRGIRAHDPVNHFSCTGLLALRLKPGDKPAPARERVGMLNLAIAGYQDISTAHATGSVDMHYVDPQKKEPMDVRGEEAFFDFDKGTANVTATPGRECALSYGRHSVTARSSKGNATAKVDEQGDIDIRGEAIHAVVPDKTATAVLDTTSFLHLTRSTRELQVGPGSHLRAPEGILTARDTLYVTLAPEESKTPSKPTVTRYPHLTYAYSGVETARTSNGGTIRSAKASMQCTGPIRVAFAPGKGGTDELMKRIRATAEGNVAVLGKDSSGRLVRGTGDRLTIHGEDKELTGSRVTLADEKNTHVAYGRGARITADAKNNVRITGEKHITHATGLREQAEKNKAKDKEPAGKTKTKGKKD